MPSRSSAEAIHGLQVPRFRDRVLMILWPSFVMAGVLEMLVFAVVDPGSLKWFGEDPIDWSNSTIYSVTFLIFWGVISTSGAITRLLELPGPPADHPLHR